MGVLERKPIIQFGDNIEVRVSGLLDSAFEKMRDVPHADEELYGIINPTLMHGLTSRLNMIQKVVLERTIMRKLYKEAGREELGFCASVSPSF